MTIHQDVLPDVFAVFKYLQEQGWTGMVSQGVIYFFPSGAFMNFGHDVPIWPIGMEALRRLGEQRGLGMEMTEQKKDLNQYMDGHLFRF